MSQQSSRGAGPRPTTAVAALPQAHAAAAAPRLLGIGCVLGAVFAFTLQDVAFKWLSGDYPLHQITLIRAFVALVIILGLFVPLEGGYENLGLLDVNRSPYYAWLAFEADSMLAGPDGTIFIGESSRISHLYLLYPWR